MILAFADDSTVCAFDSIAQANSYCEACDVEDGVFTFLDERGFILKPNFTVRPTRSRILFLRTVGEGFFTLEPTEDRQEDIVRRLCVGEISISHGPNAIRSLADLRGVAPLLFVT